MKVLVTGSRGFIGKNLIERLTRIEKIDILEYDIDSSDSDLQSYINEADFIFHLAGVNRPKDVDEFYKGNSGLTDKIVSIASKIGREIPILITSSTQVERGNDYGKSKFEAEQTVRKYSKNTGSAVYIYRLPNVFGKWSRPNYNTVIATWCYNITRDLPIEISSPDVELSLVYIDDVVEHFVSHLNDSIANEAICLQIDPVYRKTLGEIHSLLTAFKESRESLVIPRVGAGFERALYATYLSFLPTDKFSYELKGHSDDRGTFYEILKTLDSGQFSISTTKPGDILRGNHYHNTKNEKFLVVKGEAIIQLRHLHNNEVIEYRVSDKKMEIVEMIPGYTHNIKNISDEEMILFIWANEAYDHDKPDTYFLKV